MTIQLSGSIALSDIQGEFTGSNPIRLSEYYAATTKYVLPGTVGASGAIPSSGTISLGQFYGANHSYIQYLAGSHRNRLSGIGQYTTAAGNGMAVAGRVDGLANDDASSYGWIANINPATAAVNWQRVLGTSVYWNGVAVNPSSGGSMFALGAWNSGGSFTFNQLAAYTINGTLSWQRRSTTMSGSWHDARYSSSTNMLYVAGMCYTADSWNATLVKFNSSGTLQWTRSLNNATYWDAFVGMDMDSSENVVAAGWSDTGGFAFRGLVAKYNSSGSILWQRIFTTAQPACTMRDVVYDSAGAVIVCGSEGSAAIVMKLSSSSGTTSWQRKLSGSGTDTFMAVTTDASNNIYVAGFTTSQSAGARDVILAKYNTSGTLQWQRRVGYTGNEPDNAPLSISYDNNADAVIVACTIVSSGGTDLGVLLRYPQGGPPVAGTWGASGALATFAATTLTDSAGTTTNSAGGLTGSSTAVSDSASTFTDSASTRPSYKYVIY